MKTVKVWFCKILVWVMVLSMVMVCIGGVTAEEGFDNREPGESDTGKPTVVADNDSGKKAETAVKPEVNTDVKTEPDVKPEVNTDVKTETAVKSEVNTDVKTEPVEKPEVNTDDKTDDLKTMPDKTTKIESETQNDFNQNNIEDSNTKDNGEAFYTPDAAPDTAPDVAPDKTVEEDTVKDDIKPDPKIFIISFMYNDGNRDICFRTIEVPEGEKVKKLKEEPEREGFKFDYWYDEINGSDSKFTYNIIPDKNIVLRAMFKPDKKTMITPAPEKVEVTEDPFFTDEPSSIDEPEINEEPIYTETAGDEDINDTYYNNVNDVFYPVMDTEDPQEPTLPEEDEAEMITDTRQDEDDTNEDDINIDEDDTNIEDDANIIEETPPTDEQPDVLKENDPDEANPVYGYIKPIKFDYVNLRSRPNMDANIKVQMERGALVTVLETLDGWYKIIYNGIEGYVRADLLSYNKVEEINVADEAANTDITDEIKINDEIINDDKAENDIHDEEPILLPGMFEESTPAPEPSVELSEDPSLELPVLIWDEVGNLHESLLESLTELMPEPIPEPLLEPLSESTPNVNVFITIEYDEANLHYGSDIKLVGHLTGCDGLEYSLMWIKNAGKGWEEISGFDGFEYSFVLDEQNISYAYRLLVLAI